GEERSLSSGGDGQEGGGEVATSYKNPEEAVRVVEVLEDIVRERGVGMGEIAVITPYNAQKALLRGMLEEQGLGGVEVNSVDGYQGRERRVVVFSCVRSNRRGDLGFLKDKRRMNVALTRAREALVVVGDLECLKKAGGDWGEFVRMVEGEENTK
ncbi:hypothetical protein TrRE_jg13053, partial [Triparma retinervis]